MRTSSCSTTSCRLYNQIRPNLTEVDAYRVPVEQEPIDHDPDQSLSFRLLILLYLPESLLPPFRDLTVNAYVFLLVEVVM